jgi:hypothetical protein
VLDAPASLLRREEPIRIDLALEPSDLRRLRSGFGIRPARRVLRVRGKTRTH